MEYPNEQSTKHPNARPNEQNYPKWTSDGNVNGAFAVGSIVCQSNEHMMNTTFAAGIERA